MWCHFCGFWMMTHDLDHVIANLLHEAEHPGHRPVWVYEEEVQHERDR